MKALIPILALACTLQGHAQTAFTKPSGYVKKDLVVGFNPVGVNLVGEVVAAGQFDGEAGNVFTENENDLSTVLTDANATYLLEITEGAQDGAVAEITASASAGGGGSTLTIEGTGIGAGNVSYTIRKAATLNDTFGDQLQGGVIPAPADIVWVPDGSGGYDQYFYRTPSSEFRSTSSPGTSPTKPIAIFYPDGLFIQVKSTPKTITVFGEVKLTPTVVGASTGFNLITVPSPVGQTLSESNLNTFLQGGVIPASADIVWVPNGAGGYDTYFYRTASAQWRSTTSPGGADQGAVELPSTVFIQRKGADTAGVISLPADFPTP